MEEKKIFIYSNDTPVSEIIEKVLREKLVKTHFRIYNRILEDTELIICIGGDGTLLRFLQSHEFPTIPIVGINTGLIGLGVTGAVQPTTSALLHNTSTLMISLQSMKNLL